MTIFIVTRDNVYCRAFLDKQDANKYKDIKIQINHDHCCICDDNCIYRDSKYEHTLRIAKWDIIEYSIDNLEGIDKNDVIFIINQQNEIKNIYFVYEKCKHIKDIKICPFSSICLYNDNNEIEEYKYDNILHQVSIHVWKSMNNL